jgi:hypothetical protein
MKDKLDPVVARALAVILKTSYVGTPVDVLLRLQRITKQQHEDWAVRSHRLGGSVEAEDSMRWVLCATGSALR